MPQAAAVKEWLCQIYLWAGKLLDSVSARRWKEEMMGIIQLQK
jgi:hypothetical protein